MQMGMHGQSILQPAPRNKFSAEGQGSARVLPKKRRGHYDRVPGLPSGSPAEPAVSPMAFCSEFH